MREFVVKGQMDQQPPALKKTTLKLKIDQEEGNKIERDGS